ncbi:putative Protein kinase domain-containing protein [Seiridium cardinale]|uniref:EKC/KEOPS complex subunit BUD32 n=1 Tax=Seiridium cardinale TaxID=138064 RepID=A0ABR2XAL1_9PEZI
MESSVKSPGPKFHRPILSEYFEFLEEYKPGGYHPVDLYDILDGRFEVIAKLGYGGISTVWLCYETCAKRWRAVKINAASHSSEDCPDLRILKFLANQSIDHSELRKNHTYIATETFWIEGPNGRHLCSVLPVLGPTLRMWRNEVATIRDANRIKNVCFQMVEAVDYLQRLGLCHGDFRPQNILMVLREGALDDISRADMIELVKHRPEERVLTVEGKRSKHAPEFVVAGSSIPEWEVLVSDNLAVVDFGEAFEISSPPKTLGIPRAYAAPEVLFDGVPGCGTDIWSLAISLMEMRTGGDLSGDLQTVIWRMEQFAGPVPPRYRRIAERLLKEYGSHDVQSEQGCTADSCDQSLTTTSAPVTAFLHDLNEEAVENVEGTGLTDPIEMALAVEYNSPEGKINPKTGKPTLDWRRLDNDEAALLADLLRRIFKYDDTQRLSLTEGMEHPWFKTRLKDEKVSPSNAVRRKSSGEAKNWALFVGVGLPILVCLCLAYSYCLKVLLKDPHTLYSVAIVHLIAR